MLPPWLWNLALGSWLCSTSWLQAALLLPHLWCFRHDEMPGDSKVLTNPARAELVSLWAQAFGKAAAGSLVRRVQIPTTSRV